MMYISLLDGGVSAQEICSSMCHSDRAYTETSETPGSENSEGFELMIKTEDVLGKIYTGHVNRFQYLLCIDCQGRESHAVCDASSERGRIPGGCWYCDLLHGLLYYTYTVDGKHDGSSSLCNYPDFNGEQCNFWQEKLTFLH